MLLVESSWGYNSGPTVLPVVEFGMGSQVSQWFSFQAVLEKMKWQNFQKILQNVLALLAQMQAKMKVLQVLDCHFLDVKTL